MGKKRDSLNATRMESSPRMLCAKWATFGKQNWRCGMNQTPG